MKAEQKYIDELENNQSKKSGVISTKDYNKAVDELSRLSEEIGGLWNERKHNRKRSKAMRELRILYRPVANRVTDYSKTLKNLMKRSV